MQVNKEDRWMELCRQAVKEQDLAKFHQLIKQINDLLEIKQARLNATRPYDRP
jgi:hypothetical protein